MSFHSLVSGPFSSQQNVIKIPEFTRIFLKLMSPNNTSAGSFFVGKILLCYITRHRVTFFSPLKLKSLLSSLFIDSKIEKAYIFNYIINYFLLPYLQNLVHFSSKNVFLLKHWNLKYLPFRKGLMGQTLMLKILRKKEFSMKCLLSVINVILYLLPESAFLLSLFVFLHIFAPKLFGRVRLC